MLILANGAVVPHVGTHPTVDHKSTHLFTRYVRRGVSLDVLLQDCWGRGLSAHDTVLIASVNGYSLCVAEPRRRVVWSNLDLGWTAHCSEFEDLTEEDKRDIEWFTADVLKESITHP